MIAQSFDAFRTLSSHTLVLLGRDGTPSRPLRERVEGAVHLNDQVCNLQYMPWITLDWVLLYTPPPSPDSLSRVKACNTHIHPPPVIRI